MTRLFCSGYVQAISPFHVCQKALYHSAIRDFKYNVNLRFASSVSIRRHIKVGATVNPYDPRCSEYLKQRHSCVELRSKPAKGSPTSIQSQSHNASPTPSCTARKK